MRHRSLKRQRDMRAYIPLVEEFLEGNPTCHFPLGCKQRATCVHHRRGRFGKRLLDQRYWAASCAAHNDYAETHTGHSLEIGWLLRIEAA